MINKTLVSWKQHSSWTLCSCEQPVHGLGFHCWGRILGTLQVIVLIDHLAEPLVDIA